MLRASGGLYAGAPGRKPTVAAPLGLTWLFCTMGWLGQGCQQAPAGERRTLRALVLDAETTYDPSSVHLRSVRHRERGWFESRVMLNELAVSVWARRPPSLDASSQGSGLWRQPQTRFSGRSSGIRECCAPHVASMVNPALRPRAPRGRAHPRTCPARWPNVRLPATTWAGR